MYVWVHVYLNVCMSNMSSSMSRQCLYDEYEICGFVFTVYDLYVVFCIDVCSAFVCVL